ncbi:hypothetical protein Pcinc_030876 [Petrolisthes cinctipes]|uniref:Uncharacterized protein n=1 Tax=Petrolisthes cinctipes TaxID=88211 RepID=A0AAE1EXJ2_PETCI|nr:hypothetical protein Pcinc_030876 [Petrolisthes cinctipes]
MAPSAALGDPCTALAAARSPRLSAAPPRHTSCPPAPPREEWGWGLSCVSRPRLPSFMDTRFLTAARLGRGSREDNSRSLVTAVPSPSLLHALAALDCISPPPPIVWWWAVTVNTQEEHRR